jgi:hypothetical protein
VKKPKKFKRYAEGGALGAGEGDPFSYTDFSDRARNLRKPSEAAEIDRSRDIETASVKPPRVTESKLPEPVKPEKETKTEEKEPAKERGETDFNYEPQRPYNQALEDAKEQGRRARDAFKPAKPAADKAINITTGAAGFKFPKEKTPEPSSKPSYSGAGDSDDSVDTKKKNELDRLKRVGSGAVEQTMMGPVETIALGASKLPAMARAGLGAARKAYDYFTTPSVGKGTGKFPEEKPEITVPRTPAVERKAKVEGPPASAAAPKPKTPAEQMGLRETEPMRRAREAKEQFDAAGKGAKDAADRASKKASDEVAAEAAKRAASKRQTPDNRRFPNKGSATPGRPKASGEFRATNNKFDRPVGEKRGPKTDEVLEREGLPIKKGGKIPAFKKGGLVSRGDGCAQRGKTKCRMV